jgi:hypothetical protein
MRGLHILRQGIPRQSLGTNGQNKLHYLKFPSNYETTKFTCNQSDCLGKLENVDFEYAYQLRIL